MEPQESPNPSPSLQFISYYLDDLNFWNIWHCLVAFSFRLFLLHLLSVSVLKYSASKKEISHLLKLPSLLKSYFGILQVIIMNCFCHVVTYHYKYLLKILLQGAKRRAADEQPGYPTVELGRIIQTHLSLFWYLKFQFWWR